LALTRPYRPQILPFRVSCHPKLITHTVLFSVLVLHWVSSPDNSRLPQDPAVLPNINDLPFDGTTGGSMPPTLGLSFDLAQHKRAHIRNKGTGNTFRGSWNPDFEMKRQQQGRDE